MSTIDLDAEATWPLADFRRAYDEDDNIWWVIGCGHHQNLFEAACDALEDYEVEVVRLRATIARVEKIHQRCDDPGCGEESHCLACDADWPCDTAAALADPEPQP